MDVIRTFKYPFDDPDWVNKLVICAILTFTSFLFPVGVIPLAALLGYLVLLVNNVREGQPNPLPPWDDFGEKLSAGFPVVVAGIVYNLPNILIGGCAFTFFEMTGEGFLSGGLALICLCCIVPLLFIYNLLAWGMLSVGLIHYAESGESARFYRFNALLATLRKNAGLVAQYLLLSFLANLVIGVVGGAIPCLGWIAALALMFPVQGHLLGQFATQLYGKPKAKRGHRPG